MKVEKRLFLVLNQIAEGFRYIDSRAVHCGSEHAFRLPMGKCSHDIAKRLDALVAAVGAPVELIDRGGAIIVRVVKRDFPLQLQFNPDHLKDDRLLLGYDRLFTPMYLRLMHQMIGGASGAGKTMLIRFLLYQLIKIGAIVKIVDMKGYSFFPFEIFPNVRVAKTLPDAADLLFESAEELENRERQIIQARDRSLTKTLTPYVVLIDEAGQIAPNAYAKGKLKDYARFCDETCARISQKGRESRLILIYCTQKPSREIVNGQVKANVESCVAFRTNNHYESEIILGEEGAERISPATPGRCIYKYDRKQIIQVPFISEDDADWETLLSPLKTEVLHGGSSRRAEPQRIHLEGSYSSTDCDHETIVVPQRFTGPEKKNIRFTTGFRAREESAKSVPRATKDMAVEAFTDEIT